MSGIEIEDSIDDWLGHQENACVYQLRRGSDFHQVDEVLPSSARDISGLDSTSNLSRGRKIPRGIRCSNRRAEFFLRRYLSIVDLFPLAA